MLDGVVGRVKALRTVQSLVFCSKLIEFLRTIVAALSTSGG
jgi:hypothetical protein